MVCLLVAACGDDAGGSSSPDATRGDAPTLDGASIDAVPPRPLPAFASLEERCKLLSATGNLDPTANQVQFRANIQGADLGIPVEQGGNLFFFFGDTIGYKAIWQPGQSLPDSIGFASASDVAANPDVLCSQLRFLTLSPSQSLGPGADSRIQADFAAGFMTAPAGHTLGEYIHNPAGNGAFPQLPGDFEVPSGGFAYGGAIYLFYTTVTSPSMVEMKGSYLARWAAPSPAGPPGYDILYAFDERFDANGPLRGDFINVAAETAGDYVYLFGTGLYRQSPVQLARKLLSTLDTPGGVERFDAASGVWKSASEATAPIVDVAGNGELSVRYFAALDRWMMLNQEQLPASNRVIARFADRPEGPWSAAIVVADMADPAFRQQYCCAADACNGQQLFHCDRAGFYGTYLLPHVATQPGGFTVTFFLSTWDPYNVALMQASFR